MRTSTLQARRRASGFTMLEALVSILILSFGLLGLAGLFVSGAQNNRNANLRTVATQQAYNMADRMRTNLSGLTVLIPTVPYYHLPTAVQSNCYTNAAICDSPTMAKNDYYEWNDPASPISNPSLLPGGYGVVCIDSTPNDGTWNGTTVVDGCDGVGTSYAIKVWWLDDRRSAGATAAVNTTAAYRLFVATLQPQP
jgi:type IV pilus assembly protein PilV